MATATVIGGSAVLSAVSARNARRAAGRNAGRARDAQQEQAAFAQQQYDDWQEIYGPIEENLSSYFEALSPEALIAQGLQSQEQEFRRAEVSIRQNIAQRGLEGSGIEQALEQGLAVQTAVARARVRQEAPAEVARQQSSFLAGGQARRGQAVQGVNQGFQTQAAGFSQRANQQRAESAALFNASGQLLASGISNIETTPDVPVAPSEPTVLRA